VIGSKQNEDSKECINVLEKYMPNVLKEALKMWIFAYFFFLNRSIWLYELYKVTTRVAKDTVLGSYRI